MAERSKDRGPRIEHQESPPTADSSLGSLAELPITAIASAFQQLEARSISTKVSKVIRWLTFSASACCAMINWLAERLVDWGTRCSTWVPRPGGMGWPVPHLHLES